MKQIPLLLTLIMLMTTACAPTATAMPVDSVISPSTAAAADTLVPTEPPVNPKLPAASFESQTYINEEVGFALDYPVGWTVTETVVGDRGKQIQFLSAPELADMAILPENAARLNATVYQWDPKNDLAAYVATRKAAWESSGFTIVEELPLVLDLGLNAVQFELKTPDSSAVVLITALGDQYLVLTGEGNLPLVKEIVQRLRPISVR
jgi:hypothetical protein